MVRQTLGRRGGGEGVGGGRGDVATKKKGGSSVNYDNIKTKKGIAGRRRKVEGRILSARISRPRNEYPRIDVR